MPSISPDIPGLNTGETEATAQPKVTNALQEIVNLLNGALDAANIADGSITLDKLAFSIQASFIPPGVILPTAGASADSGFLLCDGTAVSRATYPNLFAKLGTRWGTGDNVSTFNLPNLNTTHRTLIGADGTTIAVGATGGTETVALTANEMPAHTHDYYADPFGFAAGSVNGYLLGDIIGQNSAPRISNPGAGAGISNAGGGAAHTNMQPYAAVLFQIKT